MAKVLTPAHLFPSVTVPEGGDSRTAASVETGFQNLTNRTHWLRQILEGAEDLDVEDAARLVKRMVPLSWGFPGEQSDQTQWATTANGWLTKVNQTGGSSLIYFPVIAPHGAQVKRVEALVHNADTVSGVAISLQKYGDIDWDTPAVPTISTIGTDTSPTSSGLHLIALDVDEAIDRELATLRVAINGSAASSGDRIYAIRQWWGDPGPRN